MVFILTNNTDTIEETTCAIFSLTPFVFVSFPRVSPCCSVSTVADCSYRLREEEENINHLTCRRKPDVFPLHLSGAAVRASVKVH